MNIARKILTFLIILLMAQFYVSAKDYSIAIRNANAETAIAKLQEATGYDFVYQKDLIKNSKVIVTVNFTNKPLETILDDVIVDKIGLSWKEVKNTIILTSKTVDNRDNSMMISGIVKDEEGDPLVGVTVQIVGKKIGVATDHNGQFAIPASIGQTLQFSYIGMLSEKVKVTSDKKMEIKMTPNDSKLSEIVITGYNTVDRRKLTSSVTTLKADDIMRPGISSIDQMLEGQVPDMVFMNNSGEVGTVPRLRIRGTSTLIGNREPLWVLDGVVLQDPVNVSPEELNNPDYINRIGNAISGINPQDIERIDVLKDASATALYGAKAANGVIVVTTKQGHVGKPLISYSMTASLKTRPRYTDRKIDLMNSQERVEFSKYLLQNGYGFGNNTDLVGYEYIMQQFFRGDIDYNEVMRQTADIESMNTDWFKEFTRDAFSTSHSVSISGGSDKARYYGSVSYTRDNDVIRGNNNERYTAAMNVNAKLSRIFSTQFGITANVNQRKYNQESLAPLDYAYHTSRAIPVRNADGDYIFYKRYNSDYGGYYNFNMLNELENSYNRQDGNAIQTNFSLNANITDWLKARLLASYQATSTNQESWWGENTYHVAGMRGSEYGEPAPSGEQSRSYLPFGGELSQSNFRNNNYMARLQFDFNKCVDANNNHNISATLGFEVSSNRYKGSSQTSRGYYENRGKQFSTTTLDSYPAYKAWLETNAYPTLTDNLSNLISGYALLSYSFKNYFTLTANARIDGSNKFGDRSNEKLLPIWSVSGNYYLSELDFLRKSWIDFIMLKASYGYQGNMLDGQSPQMIIQQLPMDPLYNELTSQVSIYPNPNLRWEKTQSWNAGVSLSVLQRRLQFEGEFYYKKTKDAFLLKDISSVNGISSYYINSGNITNKGFSLSLTAVPIRVHNFNWTLSTSFSKIYNKLQTLPGQDQYELSNYLNGTALISGKPIGTFFSYRFVGLNPKDGSPIFNDGEEHASELTQLNKNEFYTTILEASGSREPTMSGTINNTFRYRQFRLNAVLNYSFGSKVRLFQLFPSTTFYPTDNINRELIGHWAKPGDEKYTNIPNPVAMSSLHWSMRNKDLPTVATNTFSEYNYGNHRVVNGDYLKISTLSLTYEFANSLINKWGLSRLAINLTGTNLYTFCSSKLKGQTPQQSGFSEIQLTDRPQYTFGFDIQF